MSIVSVGEVFNRSGTFNSQWKRTYQRTFRVVTDDTSYGPVLIRGALPVTLGNSYFVSSDELDNGSFLNEITFNSEGEDGLSWLCTLSYGPYDPSLYPQDPTQHPIDISWEPAQFERQAIKDVNGDPVVNSANDKFNPAETMDDSRPVFIIVRNEKVYNDGVMATYRDTVNSDVFFGYAPQLVKCHSITGKLARDQDIGWYWIVTYRFEWNKDGWHKKPLDAGYKTYPEGATAPTVILDKIGVPISDVSLLDGNGNELPAGEDPVFLDFQVYLEQPFEPLNITRDMIPVNS